MTNPSKEQIEALLAELMTTHLGARQDVWLPHFAELAYAAGRKAGMEEAAQDCKDAAAQSQVTCDRLNTSKDIKTRVSSLVALGAVEQAKKLESAIRAAMEADK